MDALFTAVSVTCVTGLTTFNVAEAFNPFGQAVILVLIQLGGLGIFTASITLVLLSDKILSLAVERVILTTMEKLQKVRPLEVFVYSCVYILLFCAALSGLLNLLNTMHLGLQPRL